MTEQIEAAPQRPSLLHHVFQMPWLHKALLSLALIFTGAGVAGQGVDYFSKTPAAPTSIDAVETSTATGNTRSFVPQPGSADSAPAPEPTFLQRSSPWMTRIGFAFIAGFFVGWAFRAFLKMMSLLATAGFAIILGLSYFNVFNIDFSSVEKKYESAMSWATDQGEIMTRKILNHLPGSASGFGGMFIGFRRKR